MPAFRQRPSISFYDSAYVGRARQESRAATCERPRSHRARCVQRKRLYRTFDLDFGDIVALGVLDKPSVVLFRLTDERPESVNHRLSVVLEERSRDLQCGRAASSSKTAAIASGNSRSVRARYRFSDRFGALTSLTFAPSPPRPIQNGDRLALATCPICPYRFAIRAVVAGLQPRIEATTDSGTPPSSMRVTQVWRRS